MEGSLLLVELKSVPAADEPSLELEMMVDDTDLLLVVDGTDSLEELDEIEPSKVMCDNGSLVAADDCSYC